MISECKERIAKAWKIVSERIKNNILTSIKLESMSYVPAQWCILEAKSFIQLSVAVDVDEISNWSDRTLEKTLHDRFCEALEELQIQIHEYFRKEE